MSKNQPSLGRVAYHAIQVSGNVIIYARGTAPTPGYRIRFEKLPIPVFPPIHALYADPPHGPAPAEMTPFRVRTAFDAPQLILVVEVLDTDGRYTVAVEQAPEALVS